jgi:hypothetical protein
MRLLDLQLAAIERTLEPISGRGLRGKLVRAICRAWTGYGPLEARNQQGPHALKGHYDRQRSGVSSRTPSR